MRQTRVIYLGGAPFTGKTTVGRIIASRLQYSCLSTDDLGAALAAVTSPKTHPEFHYLRGKDYREYYVETCRERLLADWNKQHETLWPALHELFKNHSAWSCPAVIEGCALRPERLARLAGDVSGLFLLADGALLEERVRRDDFSRGASDPEAMIRNYLERSSWLDGVLREQAARFGLKTLTISGNMEPEELADCCLAALRR